MATLEKAICTRKAPDNGTREEGFEKAENSCDENGGEEHTCKYLQRNPLVFVQGIEVVGIVARRHDRTFKLETSILSVELILHDTTEFFQ